MSNNLTHDQMQRLSNAMTIWSNCIQMTQKLDKDIRHYEGKIKQTQSAKLRYEMIAMNSLKIIDSIQNTIQK